MSRLQTRLNQLAFGDDPKQRLRVQQSLMASSAYGLFVILGWLGIYCGLAATPHPLWLTIYSLTGSLTFYLMIRTGFNRRFKTDPALTIAQQVVALIAAIWMFSIAGADRGATLCIIMLIFAFGSFANKTWQMVYLSVFTLAMLAGVMVWQYRTDPATYPIRVALFQFAYIFFVIWPICILTGRMNALRRQLSGQKIALQQALEQIQLKAESDELTGLVNRRAMVPLLQNEMRGAKTGQGQICLGLIDIDKFKDINDRYGHQVGDEALRAFARISRSGLRAEDVMARWGGEEFLVMLPGTTVEQGVQCLERIREILESTTLDHIHPGLRFTISAGVTNLHGEDHLEAAVERADQAMYLAKQTGRNRIVRGALHAANDTTWRSDIRVAMGFGSTAGVGEGAEMGGADILRETPDSA